MKQIKKIEKSKLFWYLFSLSLIFFFLRLPSLIEPDWYGDEGVYQVIGIALNKGSLLYSQIWDNKPPLLYLIYALFNGDLFGVRLASLFVGLVATWIFFYLTRLLFNNVKTSIITTSVFVLLLATPLLEGNIANAENFMILPILAAAILIFKNINKKSNSQLSILNSQFLPGLLLGFAFLFKIVALFDFAAFLVFLLIISLSEKDKFNFTLIKKLIINLYQHFLPFIFGFILPISITAIYFLTQHAFKDFINAIFFSNIGYVNYGNQFLIPQGFLILKLLILATAVILILFKRKKLTHTTIFVSLWLVFSLFNAFFSQRPYTHYVLVTVSSLCLFLGLLINTHQKKAKQWLGVTFLAAILLIMTNFNLYGFFKTIFYYQNSFLFITGKKDLTSYQTFFDQKTPGDYAIASFIKMRSRQDDKIFIWGDNPQIYVLSQTLPISKYTVAYHIRQYKDGFATTQQALNKIKPKYVVILSETANFPFSLDQYISKYSINRATIYEKTF